MDISAPLSSPLGLAVGGGLWPLHPSTHPPQLESIAFQALFLRYQFPWGPPPELGTQGHAGRLWAALHQHQHWLSKSNH